MDDATYTFLQDVRSRKATARSAKHRVCGSKSKKCALPSDSMTHAQWKRRNSPVLTYNLNRPMTFPQFKALPENIQKAYLINLLENYNASNIDIAKMFGISGVSVGKRREKLGILPSLGRKARPTQADRDMWADFLHSGQPLPEEPAPESSGEMAPVEPEPEPREPDSSAAPEPVSFHVVLRCTPGQLVRWMQENLRGDASSDTYEFTVARKEG